MANTIFVSESVGKLCDGPGGGLLCGAGIGGGIGSAIDGDDGAKAGALIGGLIGITSRLNEAENQGDSSSSVNNNVNTENNQIISTDYPVSMVYNTQIALISLGYYVGVYDGSFTQNTADAIRSYQQNNSLIANGFPSKELYKHIKKNVAILYSEE
jgi:peptidoglycan hydrolase-like protein with peptidoglycan-binding domain